MKSLCVILVFASTLRAAAVSADSSRGEALFQSLACVQCHSIDGKGGKVGPDLGRRIDRNFTPASLAATMWNHAPVMWSAMRDRNIAAGNLDEQGAADLLAYFYSVRFFDKPGDAGRGKAVFAAKHCAECHGLTSSKIPEAKPVAQWESIDHPIQLMTAMWNHGANMRAEFQKRKFGWPDLSSQDLSDLLVYLRSLPVHNAASALRLTSGSSGQALFDSKGCAGCHSGKNALAPKLRGKTLTDIAADMWNHQPRMSPNPPAFTPDEMRELISFLWAGQFFTGDGTPAAGARVFTAKHCASCHNDKTGAFKLAGQFTAATMVSALWHHGPQMQEQMKSRHMPWPRFGGQDMANLIAYLNTRK